VTASQYIRLVDLSGCGFVIPAGVTEAWIGSRTSVPAAVAANSRDMRRLGVPIGRVVLSDGEMTVEVWHGYAGLHDGFHEDEETHRWTDGQARLPDALLRPFTGAMTLDVCVISSELGYRTAPSIAAAAADERHSTLDRTFRLSCARDRAKPASTVHSDQ
jgi:hypothetical protein